MWHRFGIVAMAILAIACMNLNTLLDRFDATHAHMRQGRDHYASHRHTEAIEAFTRAIEARPDRDVTYIQRAHALYSAKRYDEAITDYTAFLARRPGEPKGHWGRAQALNAIGRHREAIADANAALAINPNLPGALYHRAYAWNRLGNTAAAQRDADAALALGTADDCLEALLEALRSGEPCELLISDIDRPLLVADLVLTTG